MISCIDSFNGESLPRPLQEPVHYCVSRSGGEQEHVDRIRGFNHACAAGRSRQRDAGRHAGDVRDRRIRRLPTPDSLRSQTGAAELAPAGSAGWDFAPDQWFEVPSSLATLSAGSSAYAYAIGLDPASPAPLPSGESHAAAATPGGDGTAVSEAGSTLLIAPPVANESEGESGDDDEGVTITGRQPPVPEVTDGDNGTSTSGGGAGDGGDGGSETEQNDCRDRSALDAQDAIKAENDDEQEEHGSVIFRDANGQIRRSPPIEGDEWGIPYSEVLAWMNLNGVSMSQVIGFVHNHPAWMYASDDKSADVNRYPSGGAVPGSDWTVAGNMVSRGAGGPGGENFALYVIDTDGNMRKFEYSDRAVYESLSEDQRERGLGLPDEMKDDGSSCG